MYINESNAALIPNVKDMLVPDNEPFNPWRISLLLQAGISLYTSKARAVRYSTYLTIHSINDDRVQFKPFKAGTYKITMPEFTDKLH